MREITGFAAFGPGEDLRPYTFERRSCGRTRTSSVARSRTTGSSSRGRDRVAELSALGEPTG